MRAKDKFLIAATARLTALIADQERLLQVIRKEQTELVRPAIPTLPTQRYPYSRRDCFGPTVCDGGSRLLDSQVGLLGDAERGVFEVGDVAYDH
jgi:hypothetical protein